MVIVEYINRHFKKDSWSPHIYQWNITEINMNEVLIFCDRSWLISVNGVPCSHMAPKETQLLMKLLG